MLRRIGWVVALVGACGGKTVGEIPEPSAAASQAPSIPPKQGPSAPVDDPTTDVPAPVGTPCGPSFADDVLPALASAGCAASSSCHGGRNAANDPPIDPADPAGTYATFLSFRTSNGALYVNRDAPSLSSIRCNLSPTGTCGVHMPIGGQVPKQTLATIDSWLTCYAPLYR